MSCLEQLQVCELNEMKFKIWLLNMKWMLKKDTQIEADYIFKYEVHILFFLKIDFISFFYG